MPSLARSVPKPLKVPSLARSVPKPFKMGQEGECGGGDCAKRHYALRHEPLLLFAKRHYALRHEPLLSSVANAVRLPQVNCGKVK